VRFWKLRQSEYKAYTLQCAPAVIRQARQAARPAPRAASLQTQVLGSQSEALPALLWATAHAAACVVHHSLYLSVARSRVQSQRIQIWSGAVSAAPGEAAAGSAGRPHQPRLLRLHLICAAGHSVRRAGPPAQRVPGALGHCRTQDASSERGMKHCCDNSTRPATGHVCHACCRSAERPAPSGARRARRGRRRAGARSRGARSSARSATGSTARSCGRRRPAPTRRCRRACGAPPATASWPASCTASAASSLARRRRCPAARPSPTSRPACRACCASSRRMVRRPARPFPAVQYAAGLARLPMRPLAAKPVDTGSPAAGPV